MTSAPELHSYKTFIARSVNGIPVQGHRAVLTHAKDGSLRKVLVAWPALATTGHRLTSRLSLTQVKTRAATTLVREGARPGAAALSWRYLPQPAANGEVTLKLVAIARVPGKANADGTVEEPRIVEVDVDAE
ncbi:MAG: hypothetical protein JNK82_30415 [Myxococcaceae bacterium]|nr:hypothetical protein [Myxococcaceae bacterium]